MSAAARERRAAEVTRPTGLCGRETEVSRTFLGVFDPKTWSSGLDRGTLVPPGTRREPCAGSCQEEAQWPTR